MSPMFKSTGSGSLRRKFGEEVVDRCKSNFDTIWGDTGLSYAKKEIMSISSEGIDTISFAV